MREHTFCVTGNRSFLRCPQTVGTAQDQLQSTDWSQYIPTSVQEHVNWRSLLHARPCSGMDSSQKAVAKTPRRCRRQVGLCTAEPVCACTTLRALSWAHDRRKGRFHGKIPKMMCLCLCASSWLFLLRWHLSFATLEHSVQHQALRSKTHL